MAWTLDLDFLELALQIKYHDRKLEFLPESLSSEEFPKNFYFLFSTYITLMSISRSNILLLEIEELKIYPRYSFSNPIGSYQNLEILLIENLLKNDVNNFCTDIRDKKEI